MFTNRKLKLGTRGSPLALKQAEWVKKKIKNNFFELDIEIVKIKTYGDKLPDKPLSEFSKNDMFTKEIEEALLKEKITEFIPFEIILPDAGQGALGIEIRKNDDTTKNIVSFLNDEDSEYTVSAERRFVKTIGASCRFPVAAYAEIINPPSPPFNKGGLGEFTDKKLKLTGLIYP